MRDLVRIWAAFGLLICAVGASCLSTTYLGSTTRPLKMAPKRSTLSPEVSRAPRGEGLVLRLRGGAASDIPPLNSTEQELEKGPEEDGNEGEEAEAQNHHQHHEQDHQAGMMPPQGSAGADQGFVQLPEDLRMPPGMQHMYQWEAPDGNQVGLRNVKDVRSAHGRQL